MTIANKILTVWVEESKLRFSDSRLENITNPKNNAGNKSFNFSLKLKKYRFLKNSFFWIIAKFIDFLFLKKWNILQIINEIIIGDAIFMLKIFNKAIETPIIKLINSKIKFSDNLCKLHFAII